MAFVMTTEAKVYLIILLIVLLIGFGLFNNITRSVYTREGRLRSFFDAGAVYVIKANGETTLDDDDLVVACRGSGDALVYDVTIPQLGVNYNPIIGETKIAFTATLESGGLLYATKPYQSYLCELEDNEFDCPSADLHFTVPATGLGEKKFMRLLFWRATGGIMDMLRPQNDNPGIEIRLAEVLEKQVDTYLSSASIFLRSEDSLDRACRAQLCSQLTQLGESACGESASCYWVTPLERLWVTPLERLWFTGSCELCPQFDDCFELQSESACRRCGGDRCIWFPDVSLCGEAP